MSLLDEVSYTAPVGPYADSSNYSSFEWSKSRTRSGSESESIAGSTSGATFQYSSYSKNNTRDDDTEFEGYRYFDSTGPLGSGTSRQTLIYDETLAYDYTASTSNYTVSIDYTAPWTLSQSSSFLGTSTTSGTITKNEDDTGANELEVPAPVEVVGNFDGAKAGEYYGLGAGVIASSDDKATASNNAGFDEYLDKVQRWLSALPDGQDVIDYIREKGGWVVYSSVYWWSNSRYGTDKNGNQVPVVNISTFWNDPEAAARTIINEVMTGVVGSDFRSWKYDKDLGKKGSNEIDLFRNLRAEDIKEFSDTASMIVKNYINLLSFAPGGNLVLAMKDMLENPTDFLNLLQLMKVRGLLKAKDVQIVVNGGKVTYKFTRDELIKFLKDEAGSTPLTKDAWRKILEAKKAINLPTWNKLTVDWNHIYERHVPGAIYSKGRSLFNTMNQREIESLIRDAYQKAKKLQTQDNRILLRGVTNNGLIIEMWINLDTLLIETAYPVFP